MLRQTTIFLDDRHMAQMAAIGKMTGQAKSVLVRTAIWEHIRRWKRAQRDQIVVPVRKRRSAVLFGE